MTAGRQNLSALRALRNEVQPMNVPELLDASPSRTMWEVFAEISAIPRPSGSEGPVRECLKRRARSRGWEIEEDRVGNVVFRVPGRGGLAAAEPLMLQGHMDMVCEKERDGAHDFTRDPLLLRVEDGWLIAEGTTLGADNGIAIAMATAAAEAAVDQRLPLELLWTVDEETGLTGAMNLDAGILRSRRMINLDSESEGVFIVGCAGGRDQSVRFEGRRAQVGNKAVSCRLTGFRGGHSGINIHEGRGNAILAAAALLDRARRLGPGLEFLHFSGGTKKNAIPRDAEFSVVGIDEERLLPALQEVMAEIRGPEPGARLETRSVAAEGGLALPWPAVDFMLAAPGGVTAMDPDLEGMVRTSANLGVAMQDERGLTFRFHVRSSADNDRDRLCRRIAAAAEEKGGASELGGAYPGWPPNPDAKLLARLVEKYRALSGQGPRVTAIHAGLEAGVIGSMLHTRELVSFGPTIENAHSPSERLNISSAERTYRFLLEFVTSNAAG